MPRRSRRGRSTASRPSRLLLEGSSSMAYRPTALSARGVTLVLREIAAAPPPFPFPGGVNFMIEMPALERLLATHNYLDATHE